MVGHTAPAHVLLLLLFVVGTPSPSRAGVFDLGGFEYQWAGFIVSYHFAICHSITSPSFITSTRSRSQARQPNDNVKKKKAFQGHAMIRSRRRAPPTWPPSRHLGGTRRAATSPAQRKRAAPSRTLLPRRRRTAHRTARARNVAQHRRHRRARSYTGSPQKPNGHEEATGPRYTPEGEAAARRNRAEVNPKWALEQAS